MLSRDTLVPIINILPLSPKFIFLFRLCKNGVRNLNIFPLPPATMLSFVSGDHWRYTAGRKDFLCWLQSALSPDTYNTVSFPSAQLLSAQWSAAPSIQQILQNPLGSLIAETTSVWTTFLSILEGKFLASSRGWISSKICWCGTTLTSLPYRELWPNPLQQGGALHHLRQEGGGGRDPSLGTLSQP